MQAAKAKAKAKAKAPPQASPSVQDSARARVDKCAWCEERRQGWCDQVSLWFYCEHCWTEYDTLQGAGSADYAGRVWHDEILEEDNLAAEGEDDDGGNLLEFTKNALNQIESDKKNPSSREALDDSDDECNEEDDEVKELPQALCVVAKPPELQQAAVVVIVDTSGSMRINDVAPEQGKQYITRIAAVTRSLITFFDKQVQSGCPHKFSLISFSEASRVHFTAKPAAIAKHLVSQQGGGFAASHGTHFVEGLNAARNLLSAAVGTPHLIFSDGRPADGARMIQTAQDMLDDFPALRIHAIGFGDGLDFELLQQLTSIGRGTFAPSARSVTALHSAFASVTSTITATQTVTSGSRKSSSFSFRGQQPASGGEDALPESKSRGLKLRNVSFEPADQFIWNTKSSVSFEVRRRWFTFNGKDFKMHEKHADYKHNPISIRLQPFTQGGMRLVYCFRDSTIPLYFEQRRDTFAMREAGTDARMVAKLSKYVDAWHNSPEIVSAHAQSSAVARFYSRVFRLAAVERLGWAGRTMARIIFVECYVYKSEESSSAPAPFFVGERFLPGVFRKYNSNHGYVDPEVPESEVAQAFSHFTFQASRGKHMVLDLQGVHLDKAQRRKPHLILTDPQVVSVERSFGPGDLGEEGMRAFFRSHRCGVTCKKLGLDQDAWKKSHRTPRKEPSSSSSTGSSTVMVPVTWSTASASDSCGMTSGHISHLRLDNLLPSLELPPASVSSSGSTSSMIGPSPTHRAWGSAKAPTLNQEQGDRALHPVLGKQPPPPPPPPSTRAAEPAMEAKLINRYPPSFGAKPDGPLSALMALSGGETGRPDYDMLLQRRPNTGSQGAAAAAAAPLADQTLQRSLAEGPGALAQDQKARQVKVEACGADSSECTEATSQGGPPSPNDSQASTVSSRLAPPSEGSAVESRSSSDPQDVKKSVVYGPGGKKIALSASCRGHVVAAIAKEFSIPEHEQHLLQEFSSQPNVDFYRVEHKMDPRNLRFTQSSINPAFRDGRPVYDLLNDLNLQNLDPLRELEPLDVVWHNGLWRSLSNRRLWALKHCTTAFSSQPLFVRVRVRQPDAEFRAKHTSTNDGVSVLIAQRPRSPSPCAAKVSAAI